MKNRGSNNLVPNFRRRLLLALKSHTLATIALVISISSLQIFVFTPVSIAMKKEGCFISVFLMVISALFFYFSFKVFRIILLKFDVKYFKFLVWEFELIVLGYMFALFLFVSAALSFFSFPWMVPDLIDQGFPPLHWLPSIYAIYWALEKSGWLTNIKKT